jgi:phosphate/sulfate permease
MKNLNKISDWEKIFDWRFGIISAASWEILQNILLSLVIAFVGGFLAAMGRQAYRNYYEKKKKKKDQLNKK